jgi:hypothetical protein
MLALQACLLSAALPLLGPRTAQSVEWKPVGLAVLSIDARPAKDWELFRPDEKQFFLVRIGRRFLLLDTEVQQAWELGPEQFRRQGEKLVSEEIPKLTAEALQIQTSEALPADANLASPVKQGEGPLGNPVVRHRWPVRLRTADWVSRHAGRAWLIQVRLVDEGRVLELQLPLNIYEQIRR